MAAGSRRAASRRHQHPDARRLRYRDRGRSGIDQARSTGSARCSPSTPTPSTTAARPEFAAISAVVRRHNDISNTLSTAPHQFEPIHQRKPNGEVDARPWCLGFHAAMQPRLSAWAPLLDTRNINHGLLRSILRHCVDDHGHPLIESPRKVPKTEEFLRHAHTDIPAVVEAMRQYWMPIRYARAG